jgi:signal transduction histidine kinase
VVTPILKRMELQRPQLAGLVILLILTFGMTLFLAYYAYNFSRDSKRTAENALDGWAMVGASAWNQELAKAMVIALSYTFRRLPDMIENKKLDPSPQELAEALDVEVLCGCLTPDSVHYFFRLDLKTGSMDAYPAPPSDSVRAWIQKSILTLPNAGFSNDESRAVSFAAGTVDGEQRLIVYMKLSTRGGGTALTAYGFEASVHVLSQYMLTAWQHLKLLPQTVIASGANDSLLAARVTDRDGGLVFASPMDYDTLYKVDLKMDVPVSGMHVRMVVNPDAVGALIPGGIPRNPMPLLIALITTTGVLVISALFLIRRESELARLRADFIAGVSHELRTPLAQIRMFTETLLLGRVRSENERVRSLEIIDQEARRLSHLVENVLIFAKSERRTSRINPHITDLPSDVREAIQSFAVLCRSRDIEIRPELQEGVAAPVDRGALRQILLNLLDNAVKYGPLQQRITVGMALFDSNARIWVDDEGPGIPIAQRQHVFNRFVRLSRDVDSAVAGSGIGLAIVKELALLHSGRVWIDDAPGGGARVVIELPGAYVRPEVAAGGWAVA